MRCSIGLTPSIADQLDIRRCNGAPLVAPDQDRDDDSKGNDANDDASFLG